MKAARKLVAFDFDGVLADSMPGQERAWRRAARAVVSNRQLEDRLVENLYNGRAGPRMFEGLDASDEVVAQLRAAKDAIWLAIRDSTPLMPGAASVLPNIAAGHVVAVATTADVNYVTSLLERDGLLSFISTIVTDRMVLNPKPAPDMLFRLMRDLNIDATNTCMVGDTQTDYEMSRAAGVAFIRFASHAGAADVAAPSVSSWSALSALLHSGSATPDSTARTV